MMGYTEAVKQTMRSYGDSEEKIAKSEQDYIDYWGEYHKEVKRVPEVPIPKSVIWGMFGIGVFVGAFLAGL